MRSWDSLRSAMVFGALVARERVSAIKIDTLITRAVAASVTLARNLHALVIQLGQICLPAELRVPEHIGKLVCATIYLNSKWLHQEHGRNP